MNEGQFRQLLQEQGYREIQFKDYPPNNNGPMHTHDFTVMLLVISGEFILAREDGATTYRPGETCVLPADVEHVERSGDDGARILLGKR